MSENQEEKKDSKPKKVAPIAKMETKSSKVPWSEARCLSKAKRFDSVEAWAKGAPSSFKAANAHGWVDACTSHMSGKVVGIGKAKKKGKDQTYQQAG
jgi:hypothetical protein